MRLRPALPRSDMRTLSTRRTPPAAPVGKQGADFGRKVRPPNDVESCKDRREAENRNGERRVVEVLQLGPLPRPIRR